MEYFLFKILRGTFLDYPPLHHIAAGYLGYKKPKTQEEKKKENEKNTSLEFGNFNEKLAVKEEVPDIIKKMLENL